jgi:spermidine/putrescine transport system permease protein
MVRSISVISILILYVPLVTLVVYSFLGHQGLTLKHYRTVFSDPTLTAPLGMSLYVGLVSTLFSTVLGTLGALALVRGHFPYPKLKIKEALEVLFQLPLVLPEIVMGLSLLIWFVTLKLTLGSFSIILAHTTFSLSYVIITVKTRLEDFDSSVEEAAKDLGATPIQTFFKVTLPLIAPGIVSGALMAFTLSFLITFFTAGVGSDTLPVKLYAMIKYGMNPEIHALSSLILFSTIILILLFFNPFQRKGIPVQSKEKS